MLEAIVQYNSECMDAATVAGGFILFHNMGGAKKVVGSSLLWESTQYSTSWCLRQLQLSLFNTRYLYVLYNSAAIHEAECISQLPFKKTSSYEIEG